MTSYLYVLSIGPVQGFIAAARRTRDLFIGSHLLSEISKAAAKKVYEEHGKHGTLIFPPPPRGEADLQKRFSPSELPDAPNVANIILAELELQDGQDPRELDQRVKEAAQGEWMQYAKGAKWLAENESEGFKVLPIWDNQVNDVLELYSAWLQVSGDYNYRPARKRLMRLLAGRKSIRDFIQEEYRDHKLPKSSLDGARDTVLPKKIDGISDDLALKMRLKAGEQLCAVGLTKRLGGKRCDSIQKRNDHKLEAFPSVVRVALDPWVRGIIESDGEAKKILEEIKGICENENIAQGSGRLSSGRRRYSDFPFDGHVLYLSQIDSILNASKSKIRNDPKKKANGQLKGWEARLTDDDIKALMKIRDLAERLQKSETIKHGEKGLGFGKPERYYAIIVADGDHIGKVISKIECKEEHIRFSESLSQFADEARVIVEKHNGCMIYSGGDDVLAFLPLDCCLQAARSLHDSFGDLLKGYEIPDKDGARTRSPTLSVGIAIGHSMEPLEDMLEFGREAEKTAKKGTDSNERNGLAIYVHPRSGVPIKIREQWKSKDDNSLDERLLKWAKMYENEELPDKAAYDLHELAEDYRNWETSTDEERKNLGSVIRDDALRLLKKKKSGHGKESLKDEVIEDFRNMLNGIDSYEGISRLANELIIARRISSSLKQANRAKKNKENVKVETH